MTRTHLQRLAIGISGGSLLVLAAAAWAQTGGGSVVGLGVLPGGSSSVPRAISRDGTTVVGYSGPRAFRWRAASGTMIDIGTDSEAIHAGARGMNANGSMIFGQATFPGNSFCAFQWTAPSGLQPHGVSTTSMQGGGWNPGLCIGALARRDRKLICNVAIAPHNFTRPVIFDVVSGVTIQLQALPTVDYFPLDAEATGVSDDGRTVIRFSQVDMDFLITRWVDGGPPESLRPFPPTDWRNSKALGCSADASRIVDSFAPDAESREPTGFPSYNERTAAFWTKATGLVNLRPYVVASGISLDGWNLAEITAVSADGLTLAGDGFHMLVRTDSA